MIYRAFVLAHGIEAMHKLLVAILLAIKGRLFWDRDVFVCLYLFAVSFWLIRYRLRLEGI